MPKVDGTDFYMFRSYEAGRDGYVTLIANYIPLQDAYGGPNYFSPDADALYDIRIDNNGDGVEDLSFVFDFFLFNNDIALPIGGVAVPVPLLHVGQFTGAPGDLDLQNTVELYTVWVARGPLSSPTSQDRPATRARADRSSPSRSTTPVSRPSRTTTATPDCSWTTSRFPAAAARAASSSGSARSRLR